MIKGMEDVVPLRDPIAAQRAEGGQSEIQMSRDIIELAVAARRDNMNVIIPVTFRFPGSLSPHARQVSVAGTFNEWDPTTHALVRTSDGDWAKTLALPAGLVVYCFYVDGVPWLDPHDEGRIPNEWGTELSSRMARWDSGMRQVALRESTNEYGCSTVLEGPKGLANSVNCGLATMVNSFPRRESVREP